MSKIIKLSEKRKERLALGAALLFCFLVHILIIKQFVNWYSTDVYGYLSHAATFSGRDWSGILKNADWFYSWGYSLLLLPVMFFTSDVTVVYYIAILFNAFLCCGILLLCYAIGKKIAPEANRFLLLLCATAVSIYSSYIFQGAVMLSEIFLYFFVFLNIFLLLQYLETNKSIWGILAGISVAYTHTIHNRSIAVVIAYVIVAIVWSIKARSWKKLCIMLLPLILVMILDRGVMNHLNILERQGEEYARNTYSSQMKKIANRSGFYNIISMMKCVLGEVWYALIGSFGIIGIGIYGTVRRLYLSHKKESVHFFLYLFMILILLGMLGISVLNNAPGIPLSETGRYDIYIYGRYWETVLGIFLLIGLIECCRGTGLDVCVSILLGSGVLSAVTIFITQVFQNNDYVYWGIPAVLTTLFDPEQRFNVLNSSVVGIALMALLFYLISRKKKNSLIIAVGIWSFFNIFFSYNAIYNVSSIYKEGGNVVSMPFQNTEFQDICDYLEDRNINKFKVCSNDGYRILCFQIADMNGEIEGIVSEDIRIDGDGLYIVDMASWTGEIKGQLLYENATYSVWEIR